MVSLDALANYGAMGLMLIWFMFRTESVISKNTDAVNNLAQSQGNLANSIEKCLIKEK